MTRIPSNKAVPSTLAPDRWARLSRSVGLDPSEPVLIALSGGADSVYLALVVAAAEPRPRALAVHVDHGLRGDESRADRDACRDLCAELGLEFVVRAIELDPDAPSLEARAREARYAALAAVARERGIRTIVTGHHADDALETLLLRWTRGTHAAGLAGLRPRTPWTLTRPWPAPIAPVPPDSAPQQGTPALQPGTPGPNPCAPGLKPGRRRALARAAWRPLASTEGIVVVRPLISLRREEVRASLREHGVRWREDSSNRSARFTRNRVRNILLPWISAVGGPEALENLRAFGAAVEELEERCASLTAHLSWSEPAHVAARRGSDDAPLGGVLARRALMQLARPLRRRALDRLLCEGIGERPSRAVLESLLDALEAGRCTFASLPRGWSLQLRSKELVLEPPPRAACEPEAAAQRQLSLAFADGGPAAREHVLFPPGSVTLADGRSISAEFVVVSRGADVPRSPHTVELGARAIDLPLVVRFPRPGDRFQALGAPGSKSLSRFLADQGIPRQDRGRVPLVASGGEILWVAGVRPAESRRVLPGTTERLRLELLHPHAPAPRARHESGNAWR